MSYDKLKEWFHEFHMGRMNAYELEQRIAEWQRADTYYIWGIY